jgi:hypothetical protein
MQWWITNNSGRYWLKHRDKHWIKQEETEPEYSAIPSTALEDSTNNTWLSPASLYPLGSPLCQGPACPSSPLFLSLLLDSSIWLWDGTNTPDGVFDSPAKVLEKGFDTSSHLFTTQTINYTEEREMPQKSVFMKDPRSPAAAAPAGRSPTPGPAARLLRARPPVRRALPGPGPLRPHGACLGRTLIYLFTTY